MGPRRPATASAAALVLAGAVLTTACGRERPGTPDAPGNSGVPASTSTASAGPDIWIARLTTGAGTLTLGTPRLAVDRPGYDNQPAFLPDGSGFWYTEVDDAGQADIRRYDMASGRTVPVTRTAPESEYSATPLPDGSGFSAIRVEADSTQRLWRLDADGGAAAVLLPDLAPVGYHAWSGDRTLVLFVLGSPATLRVADAVTGQVRTIDEDIGRSLQPIPGSRHVSWVKNTGSGTEIRRLDPATGASTPIAPGVDGADFHAWTPDGTLLQASGSRLHRWDAAASQWVEVADLAAEGVTLSRLAVSPDGATLALVGEVSGTP